MTPGMRAAARLRRLQALAQMKADQESARLAGAAQARARLEAALAALSPPEPPLPAPGPADPHLIRARLAHAAWTEAQRAQVNARLALVRADWLRLLPPAQAAFGRAQVLGRMAARAENRARAPP